MPGRTPPGAKDAIPRKRRTKAEMEKEDREKQTKAQAEEARQKRQRRSFSNFFAPLSSSNSNSEEAATARISHHAASTESNDIVLASWFSLKRVRTPSSAKKLPGILLPHGVLFCGIFLCLWIESPNEKR